MGGLSVNTNNDDSISTGDQSDEKGDLSVTFGLDGKRDVSSRRSTQGEHSFKSSS